MSKTVDERVVSMQFDNKHFESNVKTTMSTLDKLKKSLNLEKSAKGLENINAAAKNCNLSPMANAVESVKSKFSALEVMGITALANITNSAVNYGKRLISAFTVDPIRTGFNEFELKMGSIQTIMASTGESLETVNKYLNELNEYSDKTIYSFSDMTSNIGKFTNAGVKLEDAVLAIKGVSNEAAISGANANEASRAMYNFAQALSAGYVKLIDWKSIENANMATAGFKQQLIDTAVAVGTLTKTTDGYKTSSGTVITSTKNFNESLQDQWMTTDVLVGTLKNYADETTDIGKKAFAAAQDVKTFSMMMDTLKEAAQSGWAATWELIVGDFEQGKTLWTKVSNVLGDVIAKSAEARNKLIAGALGSSQSKWDDYIEKVNKAGIKTEEFEEALTKTSNKHGIAIDKMIEEEGSFSKTLKRGWLTKEIFIETLEDLSDVQLKNVGYTDKQINAIRELADEAKKSGKAVDELINSFSKPTGRDLLINSFENLWEAITKPLNSIKQAWDNTFGKSINSENLYKLIEGFNKLTESLIISDEAAANFQKVAEGMFSVFQLVTGVISGSLVTGLKVLKSVLSLFGTDLLTVLGIVGEYITKFKEWVYEHTLIVGEIDKVAEILYAVIDGVRRCAKAFLGLEPVKKFIDKLKNSIKEFFASFNIGDGELNFDSLVQGITSFFDKLEENIKNIDWKKIGINITQGLASGIRSGISKAVSMIKNLGKAIIETFCNILGIASPSKLFIKLGEFIISGLIKGLSNGFSAVFETIKSLALGIYNTMASMGDKLREAFKSWNFNLGGIVIVGTIISFIVVLKKLAETAERLAKITVKALNPLEKIGDILSAVKNYIGEMAKAHSFKAKSEGFKSIAIAIALLAGSFYLLSRLDWAAVARGSVAIVVISGALALLAKAISKMGTIDIAKVSSFMLGFSVAIYVLSAAMKKLSGIYIGDVLSPIIMLTVMMTGMIIALKILGDAVSDPKTGKGISKAGGLFVKMAISIGIMALVIKTISGIPKGDIDKAINIITGIFLMYASMAILGSISKDARGVGSMLLNMSLAIGVIVIVMKQIAGIKDSDIVKGLLTIAAIEYLFAAIIAVSIFAGEHASKAGTMLLKMAFAIGVLALSMKIIATLSYEDVLKGLITMAGVESLFLRFIFISKICRKEANNVGSMMLKMAAGMALMALAIKLIARIPTGDIIKGLAFISAIEVLFGAIVVLSKFSGEYADKAGTMLLKMSAGILILVAAIALLSLLKPETVAVGTAAIVAMITSLAAVANAASKLGDCTKQLLIIGGIIAILVGAVVGLSFIEKDKLLAATASISSIIGTFALLLVATKYVNSFDVGTIKNLGVMLGIVIALGAILWAIQALEIRSSIETVASIAILLTAMAAALRIISSIEKISWQAILAVGAMTLVLVAIGGALWVIGQMKIAPAIETVASLSVLLLAMATAVRILSGGKYDLKNMGIAMLAALAMSVILLAIGGVLLALKAMDVAPSMETALALSVLLLAFAGAVAILGIIGPLAVGALVGAVAMTGVIDVVKDVMIGLGELATKVPIAEKFLEKGIEILKKIGNGLGEFISSIGVGLSSGLPEIGENVSKFIEYFSSIKPETADGINMVSKAISTIAGAGLADKLSKILGMGGLFKDLKEDLPSVGEGLKSFISELGTLTPEQIESVESACKVLNTLSKAAKNIDGQAEWAKKIFGDNGLGAFTGDLPAVASNLVSFVSNLGTVTEDQLNSVKMACSVIKELAKAGGEIDGQAEWSKKIFGDNGLGAFASDLPDAGGKLSGFVTGLGTITEDQVTSVKAACSVITALAGASKNIDGQAEWAKKIFGDNGLGAFSGDLPTVASNLKSFVDNLGTFGEEKIATVKSAAGVIQALAKLGESNLNKLATYLPSIGVYMVSFADDLVSFCEKLNGTSADSITSSVKTVINDIASIAENSLGEMNDVGTDLAGAISTGFSSNKTSMQQSVVSVLNAAKTAVTDNVDFKSTGKKLGSSLITGLNDKEDDIKDAAEKLAKAAKTAITDCKEDFVEAGKDLGRGLIKGIKDKEDDVYDAGFALGQTAVKGEHDGQQSASPSKLTIKAGKWLGEGLVIGISNMGKKVYNAGYDMGDNAINAVSNAIARISDIVNSDVDSQPTIRPVMDLDNVRSGIDTISRMFGATPSVGVLANVNAISSSMNRGQNGASDVVSAIKDIGKKLGSSGGDTYNINGITYDDGSNIAEAVKTLVRATKVERRR